MRLTPGKAQWELATHCLRVTCLTPRCNHTPIRGLHLTIVSSYVHNMHRQTYRHYCSPLGSVTGQKQGRGGWRGAVTAGGWLNKHWSTCTQQGGVTLNILETMEKWTHLYIHWWIFRCFSNSRVIRQSLYPSGWCTALMETKTKDHFFNDSL